MKVYFSAFKSDVICLTWLDLLKLAIGRSISQSAITIKRGKQP